MRQERRATLAREARGFDRLVGAWLLLSLGLLLAGLFLPAITVRALIFSRELSLFESVIGFLESGEYFLFAVTFPFTILFPLAKILTGIALWYLVETRGYFSYRVLAWLAGLSKWSMLDVFVIALMVLLADGRLLTSADIHAGVVVFAVAVLLSTFAIRRLNLAVARGRRKLIIPHP